MTSKAAIAKALLEGRTISTKIGMAWFGVSNLAREVGRCIEDEKRGGFGVVCKRVHREGLSRYKRHCVWIDYSLERTYENADGILKMEEYVKKHTGEIPTYVHKNEKQPVEKKEIKKQAPATNQLPLNL